MGSALTVAISLTRYLNVSLLSTVLIKKYLNTNFINNVYPSVILCVILFLVLITVFNIQFPDKIDIFNYYATPLPEVIEIILPVILMLYLFKSYNDYGIFIYVAVYLYMMYGALFPSANSGIDKIAADQFWKQHSLY